MTTPITDIKGVGAQTAEVLAEFGFKYAEDLLAGGVDALVKVPGFGPARAKLILEAANELCEATGATEASAEDSEQLIEIVEEPITPDLARKKEKKNKSKKKIKKKAKRKKKIQDEKKSRKAAKKQQSKKTKKSKKSAAKKKKKK